MSLSLHKIITMGGYAQFVWPAYGAMLVLFLLNIYSARRLRCHITTRLRRYYQSYNENAS